MSDEHNDTTKIDEANEHDQRFAGSELIYWQAQAVWTPETEDVEPMPIVQTIWEDETGAWNEFIRRKFGPVNNDEIRDKRVTRLKKEGYTVGKVTVVKGWVEEQMKFVGDEDPTAEDVMDSWLTQHGFKEGE